MTYFVFFRDGDVGLLEFKTISEAEKWISDRMNRAPELKTPMYTVISGKKLQMDVIQVATKVRIEE